MINQRTVASQFLLIEQNQKHGLNFGDRQPIIRS